MNWKYVPESMRVIHRCGKFNTETYNERSTEPPKVRFGFGLTPVVTVRLHPSVPAEATAIRKDWPGPVLERRAACGCVRFQGVTDGRINSQLRVVIVPASERDEVVNGWESAEGNEI